MSKAESTWIESLERFFCFPDSKSLDIIGLGNPIRNDDGVGVWITERLRAETRRLRTGSVRITSSSTRSEYVISKLAERENHMLIVDAVEFESPPGSVLFASLHDTKYGFFATHNVPLRLIPSLSTRAESVNILGIRPLDTDVGEKLSDPVGKSAQRVVQELRRMILGRRGIY